MWSSAGIALVHEFHHEVGVGVGPHLGGLLVVCACAVTAFGDLVVEEGIVELFHAGGEFAGVDGADAIVLGGGEDEGLGVFDAGMELVIRRDGSEEGALRGDGC